MVQIYWVISKNGFFETCWKLQNHETTTSLTSLLPSSGTFSLQPAPFGFPADANSLIAVRVLACEAPCFSVMSLSEVIQQIQPFVGVVDVYSYYSYYSWMMLEVKHLLTSKIVIFYLHDPNLLRFKTEFTKKMSLAKVGTMNFGIVSWVSLRNF